MTTTIGIIGLRGFPSEFKGSSGIDTYLDRIIPSLIKKNKNLRFNLYTRSWSNSKSKNPKIKINNIFCLPTKYFDTSIYSVFATLLAIKDNDVLWFHAPSSCILLPLAKLCKKKIIFTSHGIDWKRKKWSNPINKIILQFLEFICIHFSDIVTSVSADINDYFQKKYSKNSLLISPGLKNRKPIAANEIQKLKLKKNQYFLYLGRLVPEKRIEWLLNGFIQNQNLKTKYKMVIAGYIENNKYCNKLLKIGKKNKNIIFTDYVQGKLKNELISNCKFFISASNLEGNSLSTNEALEFKKNCLLSDIPIHKQLASQFPNIKLFPVNSFSGFKKSFSKTDQSLKNININNPAKLSTWPDTASVINSIICKI